MQVIGDYTTSKSLLFPNCSFIYNNMAIKIVSSG